MTRGCGDDLCSCSVGVGSSKKKRKKLYGTGCLVTRVALKRLVDELAGKGGHQGICGRQETACMLVPRV